MSAETYLNHPNFGLLFRVCLVDEHQELFTTLYAQRLFFIAKTGGGLSFEPVARNDARLILENRLRILRRAGHSTELQRLQRMYKQTFQ
ncbi:MAG: PipX family protein [Cyanobacteria bacterium P01_A01_bin.105]